MFETLTLKCFRKCLDETLNFTPGLNVIRGANEAGKTTRMEALQYALFGTPALRTSLEDAVTWGHKVSELKVVLTLVIDGRRVTFTRSHAGAEAEEDGQILATGQVGVTQLAAKLLGIDGKVAQRLVFANQGGIRGALEEGPKAIATQIESLAGFDVFDKVIERMQERLLLGSSASVEARLDDARQKLEAWVPPEPIDVAAIDAEKARLEQGIAAQQADIARVEGELTRERDAQAEAIKVEAARQGVTYDIEATRARLDSARKAADQSRERAAKMPSEDALKEAGAKVEQAKQGAQLASVYAEFQKLSYPEQFWEGDDQSLLDEITATRKAYEGMAARVRDEKQKRTEAAALYRRLEQGIVKSLDCPTCGQPIKDRTQVEARNAELKQQMEAAQATIDAAHAAEQGYQWQEKELGTTLSTLHDLGLLAQSFAFFAAAHKDHVAADTQFVPCKLSWIGPVPDATAPTLKEAQKVLEALEAQAADARKAQGEVDVLEQQVIESKRELVQREQKLAQMPAPVDGSALAKRISDLENERVQLSGALLNIRGELGDLISRLQHQQARYDTEMRAGESLREAVKRIGEELETLQFNNALLKKIRAIRPRVADRLWNQILAAVGTIFSRLRGEDSVVVKDAKGFTCNGRAVEALSGSTLDALGVAIRAALCKTFLPHWGAVILDEPASACDPDRTAALLGFLASSGFSQVLLVTHEELSETFADTLLTL
jgi:DNA repair exonuclease SbcCD ATPase subunit